MNVIRLLILLSFLLVSSIQAEEININKANAQEIASILKGVGIKRAEEIVRYREQHGEFKNAKELMKIKGIGKKIVKNNEESLRFK